MLRAQLSARKEKQWKQAREDSEEDNDIGVAVKSFWGPMEQQAVSDSAMTAKVRQSEEAVSLLEMASAAGKG